MLLTSLLTMVAMAALTAVPAAANSLPNHGADRGLGGGRRSLRRDYEIGYRKDRNRVVPTLDGRAVEPYVRA
jgi:hypothetical protein